MTHLLGMKRGVSPVIAVVLLIALTVAASGIIWAISTGLLNANNSELIIDSTAVADKNGNLRGDFIQLKIRNIGASAAVLNDAVLTRDGTEMNTWVLNANSYTIETGQIEIIEIVTTTIGEEVNNQNKVKVQLLGDGAVANTEVIIPNVLSAIPVFFEGNTFTTQGIASQGWVTKIYKTHGGTSAITIDQGDIVVAGNNADLLYWLPNDTYSLKDGIISLEFEYGDNDGIGIAFRIVDDINYYYIAYANDHNAPNNVDSASFKGPVLSARYQWELGKLVAGVTTVLATGTSSTFSIPSGSRTNLKGPYTLVLTFTGDTFAFQAAPTGSNLEEIISYSGDTQFTASGYFGIISLAAQDSRFNSIQVTG